MFQTNDEHTNLVIQARQDWIGKKVVQVRVTNSEYNNQIGRRSEVKNIMVDERNIVHVQTTDGVWCPAWLLDRLNSDSIKRKVGEKNGFSGGAEETPFATILKFHAPGSMNHGKKNLLIEQGIHCVSLSIKTMKAMIAWAAFNEEEDLKK
jgi:hypothetical protein